MAHKQTQSRSHADFRHRSQIPMLAVEDVELRLPDVLNLLLLAPRQLERLIRMRQRGINLAWLTRKSATDVQ